jgi:hypothetical protein
MLRVNLKREGMDREDALMQAGRVRLRPILMTTFALIAGMLPVALGLGEGGEFYRPLAIAIIGGTITSTLLTLLVVPTFYDSIEIAKDRMMDKMHARSTRYHPSLAFIVTMLEAFFTLTFVRLIYRSLLKPGAHQWAQSQHWRCHSEPVRCRSGEISDGCNDYPRCWGFLLSILQHLTACQPKVGRLFYDKAELIVATISYECRRA